MIWYHRLHEYTRVYIHSKLHIQLGARRNKLKLKRKWLYVKQWAFWMELFCLNVWWYMYAIAKFPKFDTLSFPFKMWQVFPFVGNIQGGDEFLKSIHVVTFLHWKDEWQNRLQPNSLKCFGHFVIKSVYFGLWNKNSNFVWFRTVFCQTYHCTNPQSIFK